MGNLLIFDNLIWNSCVYKETTYIVYIQSTHAVIINHILIIHLSYTYEGNF